MSIQLISEMLLEREIKRLEDAGMPEEQKFIYYMCKKELAVISKLKVNVDMRGEIEECNQRIANQAIYFMDSQEFKSMEEKARRYDAIASLVRETGERRMNKYTNISWENREEQNGIAIQEGTPVPPEIAQYYMEHGYAERGIPLNANTCKEIAELL